MNVSTLHAIRPLTPSRNGGHQWCWVQQSLSEPILKVKQGCRGHNYYVFHSVQHDSARDRTQHASQCQRGDSTLPPGTELEEVISDHGSGGKRTLFPTFLCFPCITPHISDALNIERLNRSFDYWIKLIKPTQWEALSRPLTACAYSAF